MAQVTDPLNTALADRYVIERELGAGGMATVYLARDLKHDRKVALEVLRAELAAVIGGDRFLAEIASVDAACPIPPATRSHPWPMRSTGWIRPSSSSRC